MSELGTNMEEPSGHGISRRRVLQGAAWSVPAVMVASQLPAFAIGTPPDITIDFGRSPACKLPGNSWGSDVGYCYRNGYIFWAQVVNSSDVDVTVLAATSVVLDGDPACVVGIADPGSLCAGPGPSSPTTVLVPAETTKTVAIFTDSDSDANSNFPGLITLEYQFAGQSPEDATFAGTMPPGGPLTNTSGSGSCRPPADVCAFPLYPISACGAGC